jgi:hypothetical protein
VVDDECTLFEGAQDGTGMRIGAGVHEDISSAACVHSLALRRLAVETPKGAGIGPNIHQMLMKLINREQN